MVGLDCCILFIAFLSVCFCLFVLRCVFVIVFGWHCVGFAKFVSGVCWYGCLVIG